MVQEVFKFEKLAGGQNGGEGRQKKVWNIGLMIGLLFL